MPALTALDRPDLRAGALVRRPAGDLRADLARRIRGLLRLHGAAGFPDDRAGIRHQYLPARRRFHGPPELHSRCAALDQRCRSAGLAPSAAEKRPIRGEIEFRHLNFTYPTHARAALRRKLNGRPAGHARACTTSTCTFPPARRWPLSAPPAAARARWRAGRAALGSAAGHAAHRRPLRFANGRSPTLRRAIGFVPQDTYLFSETVRENIAFGVDDRRRRSGLRSRRNRQHRRGNRRASRRATKPWSASAASRSPAARNSAPPWRAP